MSYGNRDEKGLSRGIFEGITQDPTGPQVMNFSAYSLSLI